MKRDMDLIRRIAIETELLEPNDSLNCLEGVDAHAFAAHAKWMSEAGLVDVRFLQGLGRPVSAVVLRLTWVGCEFLDAARSDTVWARAKKSVMGHASSFTIDLLMTWLKKAIAEELPALGGLS